VVVLLSDFLNVLLGVIASFIGWLLLTKALRPRIILGDNIECVIQKDSSEYYRLTYKNPRVRRVEDVHVTVRIFYEATARPGARRTWVSSNIPVDEPFRPVLGILPLTSRIARRLHRRKGLLQRVTLQLERVEGVKFFANLPEGCPSITQLDEFLRETDSTIEFAVRAADGYSGTYRTVARRYKKQDVLIIDRRDHQVPNDSEVPQPGLVRGRSPEAGAVLAADAADTEI
jgi:hypothetical protein